MTFEDPIQPTKKKVCTVCKREFPPTQAVCPHDKSMLMFVQKDELLGTILNDRYRVLSEVGRGGMSIVYKGLHEMMDRTVAIKMLQTQHVTDQLSIKRFQQEAQAASHLQHPHVITVYDCGVVATGQPYIVMDFLEGQSLSDVVKAENYIAYQRAIPIFISATEALEHAHQKGVIHRDLKSSNIMLVEVEGRRDFVKVVDFGIAKLTTASGKTPQNLTQTGEIFGSPIYMSPEQCLGLNLDSRSDIYSMGAVLYETLTGFPPLMSDTIYATMKMHVSQMPEPFNKVRPDLRIPEQLERITFKALAKKPEQRYQTMQEMRDALEQCISTQFETGSVPSLISAPPSMGFNPNPQSDTSSVEIEDFDLSGGLFGNDPSPTMAPERRDRSSAPFVSGPDQHKKPGATTRSGRKTSSSTSSREDNRSTGRSTGKSTGRSTGRSTGIDAGASGRSTGRSTGVRKPAVVEKKKKGKINIDFAKYLNKKVIFSVLGLVVIPGLITGIVMTANKMGNDNPFSLTKTYEGVLLYLRAPTHDSESGQELPGLMYLMPNKAKEPLKVLLTDFNLEGHLGQADRSDQKPGAIWHISGHRGPNNSLQIEEGDFAERSDNNITPARQKLEEFLGNLFRSRTPGSTTLELAYKNLSIAAQKREDPERFKEKYSSDPHFKEDFKADAIEPSALKVGVIKSSEITFYINGKYLFDKPEIYLAKMISEDHQWKVDSLEPCKEDLWKSTLPD
ncbi:MAG: protein kinase [Candidatus Melainabacteria bacterium]|nr:protein kinase [Candidatus Melainabacteria bacterium]